jgi:hypothetical protein
MHEKHEPRLASWRRLRVLLTLLEQNLVENASLRLWVFSRTQCQPGQGGYAGWTGTGESPWDGASHFDERCAGFSIFAWPQNTKVQSEYLQPVKRKPKDAICGTCWCIEDGRVTICSPCRLKSGSQDRRVSTQNRPNLDVRTCTFHLLHHNNHQFI